MSLATRLLCLLLLLCSPLNVWAEDKPEDEVGSSADENGEGAANKIPDRSSLVRVQPDVEQNLLQALSAQSKGALWLVAEPPAGDAPNYQFLALEKPETRALRQGAVVLLHGFGGHPDWPEVINPLRSQLPDFGWYTLSVSLPEPEAPESIQRSLDARQFDTIPAGFIQGESGTAEAGGESAPEDGAKEEPGEEDEAPAEDPPKEVAEEIAEENASADIDVTATDAAESEGAALSVSTAPYSQRVVWQIQGAINSVIEKGYQNVVIVAHREGVDGLIRFLSEPESKIAAQGVSMIWIDGILSEESQLSFAGVLSSVADYPILDLVGDTSPSMIGFAQERRDIAVRAGMEKYAYRQMPLAQTTQSRLNTRLTQSVRGWLKTNAPGMTAKSRP